MARAVRSAATVTLLVLWAACTGHEAGGTEPARLAEGKNALGYRQFEATIGPLEERLFADAADGRFEEHSLLEAALVAGGAERPETVDALRRVFDRHVAEVRQSGLFGQTDRRSVEVLFAYMHRRILTSGYRLSATDPALPLVSGEFNCVSGTVLFLCLGTRLGLDVRAMEVPGHAFCRVILPNGALDVETTCPQWFRLVDDPKKRLEVLQKVTRVRSGEPHRDTLPREVSPVELVATIYYNRGIDLLGRKRFAEAVAANAKALRLDPTNATARENLAAILNNWAIAEASSGRHEEAARLLDRGIAAVPDFATFYGNRLQVYRGWMRMHLEAGHREAALAVARSARSMLRSVEAWPAIEADEIRQYADRWGAERRWPEVVALLDHALQLQPDCPTLVQARAQAMSHAQVPALQSPAAPPVETPDRSVWTSAPQRNVE